jgi:uncharacterized protein YjeT (DUF2065 family)
MKLISLRNSEFCVRYSIFSFKASCLMKMLQRNGYLSVFQDNPYSPIFQELSNSALFNVPLLTQKKVISIICDIKPGLMTMRLLFCLIGLLLVVEGIPYFAFPDKMKRWMNIIQEIPDSQLRIIGFVSMCVGVIIAYLFR